MKKVIKVISIIAIFIIFFITVCYGAFGVSDLKGNQKGMSDLTNVGKYAVSIITSIGVVVSVIVIAAIGVKYMLGSAAEKAEYKRTLMPYLIGAALVFGASTIAQIIYLFVK